MIDLSICIVLYKNYDDGLKAVSSIEEFTPSTISKKIYLVDNSMNDCPRAFIDSVSQYDDVKYIASKENLGFGKGHNSVLPYLDSKYHAILNPDLYFFNDAFTPVLNYLDSDEQVGMVIPKIISPDGTKQLAYRQEVTVFDLMSRLFFKRIFPKRIAEHTLQNNDFSKPFQVPFAHGCCLIIRTELFQKLKGFDEQFFLYLEDADLSKRVNMDSTVMYYPGASVVHKWNHKSYRSPRHFLIHLNSARKYFKKWGYQWS